MFTGDEERRGGDKKGKDFLNPKMCHSLKIYQQLRPCPLLVGTEV
jgi:hypothetical protein